MSVRDALRFCADIADEELQYAQVGTGAEVALRHISRKCRAALAADEKDVSELVGALKECELQLEYLAEKFQPTSTGVAVLSRVRAILAKHTPKKD